MQVNCSINHNLNKTVTDEELCHLARLIEKNFFAPRQRVIVESYVSKKSIENFLNAYDSTPIM